nr:MAG TPA: hypothetical protein [Caudoviricetes sp.]
MGEDCCAPTQTAFDAITRVNCEVIMTNANQKRQAQEV